MNKSNLILASVSAIIFTSILIIFSPNSKKTSLSSSIPDLTANWRTYENKTLNFSFSYPEKYGVFAYKTSNGETGKNFIASASGINFGGISTDFSEGRSGIFLDFSGYTNINGSITYKSVQEYDQSWPIDKELISEIFTNQNNVEVVLIKGENGTGESEEPIAGTPGEGKIGALINLKNSEFPGIAFYVDSKFGIQSLKEILSTFKFTDTKTNSNNYDGCYVSKNAVILIETTASGFTVIRGDAWWESSLTVNVGNIGGALTIRDNWVNYSDGSCIIDFDFNQNIMVAKEKNEGQCGGLNVTFNGEYHISNSNSPLCVTFGVDNP